MHLPFNSIPSRFTLIDGGGIVIYDSDEYKKEKTMDNHLNREEIREASTHGEGFSIRKSITQNVEKAYFAIHFRDRNNNQFFIRVSQNFSDTEDKILKIIVLNITFFLILNLMIHFFYKNYLKKELILKLNTIKEFLESNEDDPKKKMINLKKDDWLFSLWKVAEKWQFENIKNIKSLKNEKLLLNEIISSVDMSIVLIDKKFKVLLRNSALNFLFEKKGQDIFSSIKNIEILDIVKSCTQNKISEYSKEIYFNEYKRFFLITVKYLEESGSFLLLIKDITVIREFVETQKKFISNVSHELKTPLTNVKGYLIALEDAPNEMKKSFFSTIYNNINKLENIIGDFLNISKIENSNIVTSEEIPIEKIRRELNDILFSTLSKKNGEFSISYNELHGSSIFGDYEKIKLILKNLIENGIIYNNSSTPKVLINLKENEYEYILDILDNGIGIDKNQIDKIFERFYRVDEARTTNLSGTGLGLSIVKETLGKLCASIEVKSELGIGTNFSLKIPKR